MGLRHCVGQSMILLYCRSDATTEKGPSQLSICPDLFPQGRELFIPPFSGLGIVPVSGDG